METSPATHFWTSDAKQNSTSMEIAALALFPEPAAAPSLVPRLIAMRNAASESGKRIDLDLLLAQLFIRSGDSAQAFTSIEALLRRYPDSPTALSLAGQAYALRKDFNGWNALLGARLAKYTADRRLLLEKALAEETEGRYAQAQTTVQAVLAGGRASLTDFNNYAWLGLFTGKVDQSTLDAALRATGGTKPEYGTLHTLACVYAALGRTTEARETLLQAMQTANQVEPDEAVWFGFGLIYEQLGERDAAIAAYRRVIAPSGTPSPLSTYKLAELHLAQLQPAKP